MGKVVADEIMCIYDGWTLAKDGRRTHVPHQENAAVNSYPVAVRKRIAKLYGAADRQTFPNQARIADSVTTENTVDMTIPAEARCT